jgi:hypothetical protein
VGQCECWLVVVGVMMSFVVQVFVGGDEVICGSGVCCCGLSETTLSEATASEAVSGACSELRLASSGTIVLRGWMFIG